MSKSPESNPEDTSDPHPIRFRDLDLVDWSKEEDFVRQLKATVAPIMEENNG